MTNVNIASLLRGCEVGRMQTVGVMQVIPLISDLQDDRFVSTDAGRVGTQTYGHMVFENESDKTMLVPANAAFIVKQSAQDHAMWGAGLVKGKSTGNFRKTMCIQGSQPNAIRMDKHKLAILPLSLREKAIGKRHGDHFGKLWEDIAKFSAEAGSSPTSNLVDFMNRFQKELDQFVAEFEVLPNQVGAIVLIGGKVMGVERTPSTAYFKSVWQALIRECYGSEAIRQVKLGWVKTPRTTQVRAAGSLIDLREALKEAREKDEEVAKGKVRGLLEDPFSTSNESSLGTFLHITVENSQFVGQIVKEGERVHYASLVTKAAWASDTNTVWREAKRFSL
jgi:hypothetical protein